MARHQPRLNRKGTPFQARESKNPWTNPSKSAIARVRDPLPQPIICPCCGGRVLLLNNEEIYGMPYGEWPYAFVCENRQRCGAYVGLHPFTDIPLGTLATAPTREARKTAKASFNRIWQGGRMTRSDAYAWLAARLGLAVRVTHFGMFDADTCARALEACADYFNPTNRNERKKPHGSRH
jgi:hypothetical protein